jgi:hypothetical protein
MLTEEVFAGLHDHRVARTPPEVGKIYPRPAIRIGDGPRIGGRHSTKIQTVRERAHVAREAIATKGRALPGRIRIRLREGARERSPPLCTAWIAATVCADEEERPGYRLEAWIASSRECHEIEIHHVAGTPEVRPSDPALRGARSNRETPRPGPVRTPGLRIRSTRAPSERSTCRSSAAIPGGIRASRSGRLPHGPLCSMRSQWRTVDAVPKIVSPSSSLRAGHRAGRFIGWRQRPP